MRARSLTILCIAYVAFVLCGSLMPFDLRADWRAVEGHFARVWAFWPFGPHHASRTDMLANVALYVPLGLLLATRLRLSGVYRWLAILAAVEIALVTSLTVEGLQLLSESRVSQGTDLLMNSIGGLLGGVCGAAAGARLYTDLLRRAGEHVSHRPIALAAGAVLCFLAADAIFPFLPTLDIGEIRYSLRHSRVALGPALAEFPWHHWVAHGAGYAVLAALWGASMREGASRRFLVGSVLTAALALATEAVRPFFVTSPPNFARFATGACGAALGGAAAAVVSGRMSSPARRAAAALLLLGCLAYAQWQPFGPTLDAAAVRAKLPVGADWLPFRRYAVSGTHEDVRGFLRLAALAAALAFAVFWRPGHEPRRRRALLSGSLAGGLGVLLAAGQLVIPSRAPCTADVLCLALGGMLGGWVASAVTLAPAGSAPPAAAPDAPKAP